MAIVDEGWEGLDFKAQDTDITKDVISLDMKYAKVFSTPEGQEILQDLVNRTLELPTWYPELPDSYGYVREGQNMIVREITKRIKRATTKQ